jgi:hypothetical protein
VVAGENEHELRIEPCAVSSGEQHGERVVRKQVGAGYLEVFVLFVAMCYQAASSSPSPIGSTSSR